MIELKPKADLTALPLPFYSNSEVTKKEIQKDLQHMHEIYICQLFLTCGAYNDHKEYDYKIHRLNMLFVCNEIKIHVLHSFMENERYLVYVPQSRNDKHNKASNATLESLLSSLRVDESGLTQVRFDEYITESLDKIIQKSAIPCIKKKTKNEKKNLKDVRSELSKTRDVLIKEQRKMKNMRQFKAQGLFEKKNTIEKDVIDSTSYIKDQSNSVSWLGSYFQDGFISILPMLEKHISDIVATADDKAKEHIVKLQNFIDEQKQQFLSEDVPTTVNGILNKFIVKLPLLVVVIVFVIKLIDNDLVSVLKDIVPYLTASLAIWFSEDIVKLVNTYLASLYEPQSGGSIDLVKMFSSGLVSMLFKSITSKLPNVKELTHMMRFMNEIPRTGVTFQKLWFFFEDKIYTVYQWIVTTILKKPLPSSYRSHGEKVDVWIDKARTLLIGYSEGSFKIDLVNFEYVTALTDEGKKLEASLVAATREGTTLDRLGLQLVSRLLTEVIKLLRYFNFLGDSGGAMRQRPVGIVLRGATQVGKSYATEPLLYYLIAKTQYDSFEAVSNVNLAKKIFFKAPNSDYFDGYLPEEHIVMVHDDAFAVRPAYDKTSMPEGIQLMREINDAPYLLNMAQLENKGNSYFKSQFVIASTNKMDKVMEAQISSEPVWARISFDINVYPKQEYSVNNEYRIEYRVLNTAHPKLKERPGWFDCDVAEYHWRLGSSNGERQICSFKEMGDLIIAAWQDKRERYKNYRESLAGMVKDIFVLGDDEDLVVGKDEEIQDLELINKQINEAYNEQEVTIKHTMISDDLMRNLQKDKQMWKEECGVINDLKEYLNFSISKTFLYREYEALLAFSKVNTSLSVIRDYAFMVNVVDNFFLKVGMSDTLVLSTNCYQACYYYGTRCNWRWNLFLMWRYDPIRIEKDFGYGFVNYDDSVPLTFTNSHIVVFHNCNVAMWTDQFFILEYEGFFSLLKPFYCNSLPTLLSAGGLDYICRSLVKYQNTLVLLAQKCVAWTTKYESIEKFGQQLLHYGKKYWYMPFILDFGFKLVFDFIIRHTKKKINVSQLWNICTKEKEKFTPNASGEKPRQTGKVKRDIFFVGHTQAQSAKDINAEQIMVTTMKHNWYHVISPHTGRLIISVLFVKGRTFIAPYHFLSLLKEWYDDGDLEREGVLYFVNQLTGVTLEFTFEYLVNNFKPLLPNGEGDIGYCQVNGISEVKDITGYFVSEKTHKLQPDLKIMLPRNEQDMLKVFVSKGQYQSDINYQDENGEQYRVLTGVKYRIPTEVGDCGAPCFIHNVSVTDGKMLGIHTAGSPSMGMGVTSLITKEMLNQYLPVVNAFGGYKISVEDISDELPVLEPQALKENIKGNFRFLYIIDDAPASPSATKIRKSPLYNTYAPSTKTPSRRFIEIEGRRIDLRYKSISEYGEKDPVLPKNKIDGVWHCVFQQLVNTSEVKQFRHRKIFDFDEAVAGIPEYHLFKGISRKTSPGYPYINKKSQHSKGKTAWFGAEGLYQLSNDLVDTLRKDVDELILDYVQPDLKRRQMVIFMDVDKDELLPKHKVLEGKLRMFSGGPLHYLVLCRMYFMGFCIWILENKIDNHCAIGINVYSDEWGYIADKFFDKKNLVAGDWSKFDKKHIASVIRRLAFFINNWYNGSEEENIIRLGIIEDLVNSVHCLDNELYQWYHALPSGHFLTIIINSLLALFYLVYVYEEMAPDYFKGKFFENVYPLVGGDDHVLSINKAIVKWFNFKTIQERMPVLNQKYTSDAKNDETYTVRPLSEVSFYKRRFVYDNFTRTWLMPLDLLTILEMPQWTKSALNREQITRDNVKQALLELSLHDHETWRKWFFKITNSAIKCIDYDLSYYTQSRAREEALCLESFF